MYDTCQPSLSGGGLGGCEAQLFFGGVEGHEALR